MLKLLFTTVLLSSLVACSSSKAKKDSMSSTNMDNQNKEMKTNLPMEVATVNFEFDSSNVNYDETEHIDKTVEAINKVKAIDTDYKVVIIGHADKLGTDEYNRRLGYNRAQAIKKELIQRGISSEFIEIQSHGENHPLVQTDDFDRMSQNRRATVEIISANNKLTGSRISLKK